MHDKSAFLTRLTTAYAKVIVKHPGKVLGVLLTLGVVSAYLFTQITIEKDQLKLISQDLQEVKEVQRVIDMVGGAGYLMLALRGSDEKALKTASDDIYKTMLENDPEHVRF